MEYVKIDRPHSLLGNFINRAEALKGKSYEGLSGSVNGG